MVRGAFDFFLDSDEVTMGGEGFDNKPAFRYILPNNSPVHAMDGSPSSTGPGQGSAQGSGSGSGSNSGPSLGSASIPGYNSGRGTEPMLVRDNDNFRVFMQVMPEHSKAQGNESVM